MGPSIFKEAGSTSGSVIAGAPAVEEGPELG